MREKTNTPLELKDVVPLPHYRCSLFMISRIKALMTFLLKILGIKARHSQRLKQRQQIESGLEPRIERVWNGAKDTIAFLGDVKDAHVDAAWLIVEACILKRKEEARVTREIVT